MTDELVKRLRYLSRVFRNHDIEDLTRDDYLSAQLYPDEAADRIEALTAQLAEDADRIYALTADRENRLADLRIIKAERDRLREALEQFLIEYDVVDLANAEPSSMTAAVLEARAALKGESNE